MTTINYASISRNILLLSKNMHMLVFWLTLHPYTCQRALITAIHLLLQLLTLVLCYNRAQFPEFFTDWKPSSILHANRNCGMHGISKTDPVCQLWHARNQQDWSSMPIGTVGCMESARLIQYANRNCGMHKIRKTDIYANRNCDMHGISKTDPVCQYWIGAMHMISKTNPVYQ